MRESINPLEHTMLLAGAGELGKAIVKGAQGKIAEVIVGNRDGKYKDYRSYKIGDLKIELPEKAFGVVTCTAEGIAQALYDFKDIPTIIATSGYDKNIHEIMGDTPLLQSPNLAIAIVELQNIFNEQESFAGMSMQISESHQAGKIDPSGTALAMRNIFVSKGGVCEYDENAVYNSDEGISALGDIETYRGQASTEHGVPNNHLMGHGYHDYEIQGTGENCEQFKANILAWKQKYQHGNGEAISVNATNKESRGIHFGHYVNGREVYAKGLLEVLPRFLSQKTGQFLMPDYIKSLGQISE